MATQSASTTTLEAVDEKVKEEKIVDSTKESLKEDDVSVAIASPQSNKVANELVETPIPAVAETDDAPKSVTDTVQNQSEDEQQSFAKRLETVEGEKAQIVHKSLVEVTEKTKECEEAPNKISDEKGEAPEAVDTPQLIVEEKPLQQSVISEELEDVCKEIKKLEPLATELEVNAQKQPELSIQPDLVSADKVKTDSESSGVREQVEVQNTDAEADAIEIKYEDQSGITKEVEPQTAIQEVEKMELIIPGVEVKPESGLLDSTLGEPEKMEIVVATEAAVKCEEHPQVDEQVETVSKDVEKIEPVAPQVEAHIQQEEQSAKAEQLAPIASSEVDKKPEEKDEQIETFSKDVDKKEPVAPQVEVEQEEQPAEAEKLAHITFSEVHKKPEEEDEQVESLSKNVDTKEPVAPQVEVHVQQEEQSAEAEKLAPIASSEVDKKPEEESEFTEKVVDNALFDPKVSMGVESARDTGSVIYAESSKEETTSQEEANTIKSSEQVVPTNDQIKANTEDGLKEKFNADEDKPELKDVGVVEVPLKEAGLDVGKPAAENKVMTTKLIGENEEKIVTTERSATNVKDDGVASVDINKDINIGEGITTDDQQVQASEKSGLEEIINISADSPEKEKNDKNGKADVEKDGPEVIQELAKEVVVKATQKQSNNIIAKVKQSLVKAKKAIIGKSPNSKTQSENKVK